jgi:hypothetical protein
VAANIHNAFDVVMKRIVESDPLGMVKFLGLAGTSTEPFDADLATIKPQADYILKVTAPDYLAHIEFQSTYTVDMGRRMLMYSAVTHYNTSLPVESTLILLREQADGPCDYRNHRLRDEQVSLSGCAVVAASTRRRIERSRCPSAVGTVDEYHGGDASRLRR